MTVAAWNDNASTTVVLSLVRTLVWPHVERKRERIEQLREYAVKTLGVHPRYVRQVLDDERLGRAIDWRERHAVPPFPAQEPPRAWASPR